MKVNLFSSKKETNVVSTPEIAGLAPEAAASYFNGFRANFPTVEARLDAARQLADPSSNYAETQTYPTRNVLNAQWGETEPVLRDRAIYLYGLKEAIRKSIGQPVIVVRQGSIEDITDDAEENYFRLNEDVELYHGILDSPDLHHGFAGNTTNRGPAHKGIKPPYLRFGTQLSLSEARVIKADILGEGELGTPKETSTLIPAYLGIVPLDGNVETYRAQKNIQKFETVIGEAACRNLLESLASKVSDEMLQKRLGMLALEHVQESATTAA